MSLEADLDPDDPEFGDDEDIEAIVSACLVAQERLLYEVQGATSENLLLLAVNGALAAELGATEVSSDVIALIKEADWADENAELTQGEAQEILIAFLEGIAGLFIYMRWPIDEQWITRSDDFALPIEVEELPFARQAETLIWYAEVKGVPLHLYQGMLSFFALDIPPGELH